jgi:tetratricopeptide (TPR) repeat protein
MLWEDIFQVVRQKTLKMSFGSEYGMLNAKKNNKKNGRKKEFPSRNTVKEVYDFVIADLKKAATLMNDDKSSIFASKEVAEALLSRIYLYMGDHDNAILYANKVIESGRYELMETETYKKYFTVVPENNPETIFAIRHTKADNRLKRAIGSMYYNDPVTQSTGCGEVYASMDLIKLMNKYPEDARHSFIELQLEENGDTLKRGKCSEVLC